jgi:3-oxoacyl-[acyl-carrier protein] reductase
MNASLLDGRRAVVTGAARGLGEAMAKAFLQQGAAVVIADLDADVSRRTAKALAAETGGFAAGIACDVASEDAVRQLTDQAAIELGGIDIWVNNAGILRNKSLAEATLADFRDLIDVHVQGSWLGIKHVAPVMRGRGGGSIINMSSIGGKAGLAGQTNYSTAKAAIIGLTKAAAKELAPDRIRVNAILPGIINTAMAAMLAPEDLAARISDIPLGRLGDAAEIGSAAVFLASDMSSYVTGAMLEVSGGRFM